MPAADVICFKRFAKRRAAEGSASEYIILHAAKDANEISVLILY